MTQDLLSCHCAARPGLSRRRFIAGSTAVLGLNALSAVQMPGPALAQAKPHRIESLPPAGSVFRDYIAQVYAGARPTLPLADIYAACEVTLAAHEAAVERKVVACRG